MWEWQPYEAIRAERPAEWLAAIVPAHRPWDWDGPDCRPRSALARWREATEAELKRLARGEDPAAVLGEARARALEAALW